MNEQQITALLAFAGTLVSWETRGARRALDRLLCRARPAGESTK